MIVNCPSCQTRYHWRAAAGGRAVCGRCDAQVPLVAARPMFVVRAHAAAVAVAAGPGAGSFDYVPDEPQVRPAVRGNAGAEVHAFPVEGAAGGIDLALPELDSLDLPATGSGPERASRAARPGSATDREPQVRARGSSRASAGSGSTGRRLAQLIVVMLVGGAGVAAGHYAMMESLIPPLRVHPALESIDPRLVGGLLGMLISWPVVRWTSRRR